MGSTGNGSVILKTAGSYLADDIPQLIIDKFNDYFCDPDPGAGYRCLEASDRESAWKPFYTQREFMNAMMFR